MVADICWEEITEKTAPAVMDRLRWLQLHRCDTQIFTRTDGRKFGVLRVPLTCLKLDQDIDGKYFCKDYANRPNVCRNFICPKLKRKQGTPENSMEPATPPQG